MFKIYIAIGAVVALLGSSFWGGYQIASGKCAKKQVKVIAKAIEDNNQDKVEIAKHVTEVKETKARAVREIIKIKEVIVTTNICPLGDVAVMRNQAYTTFPANLFFQ